MCFENLLRANAPLYSKNFDFSNRNGVKHWKHVRCLLYTAQQSGHSYTLIHAHSHDCFYVCMSLLLCVDSCAPLFCVYYTSLVCFLSFIPFLLVETNFRVQTAQ